MSIVKTTKVDYKQKTVKFENNELIDENGNMIPLLEDLKTIFKGNEFAIIASISKKNEYDVEDFAK